MRSSLAAYDNQRSIVVFYPFISHFGGIERLILDLSRWLDANEINLTLVGFQNDISFHDFGAKNLNFTCLKARRNIASETIALRSWYRSRSIHPSTILVLEMLGAKYASTALPRGYNLHISDPPSLLPNDITKRSLSLRNTYNKHASRLSFFTAIRGELAYRKIRSGIQKASAAITMTSKNALELETAFGRPFSIIPQGARLPSKPIEQKENSIPRFLSVCRLEETKRLDSILHAFAKLRHPTARLTIVGNGSKRQSLEVLSGNLGLSRTVSFTGEVSETELENIYLQHNIFLMPAVQGYGLPALEALSRGLSLIVHKDSGVSEYLADIPQVQIIEDLTDSLLNAMQTLATTTLHWTIPEIQTADQWSEQLATLCGWQNQ